MTFSEDLRWRAVVLYHFELLPIKIVSSLLDAAVVSIRRWTSRGLMFYGNAKKKKKKKSFLLSIIPLFRVFQAGWTGVPDREGTFKSQGTLASGSHKPYQNVH